MIRVAILTISDSAVARTRQDLSGPALADRVVRFGWQVALTRVMPDEVSEIAKAMAELADSGEVDVILSTGGTGLALRDVTPEAAKSIAHREAPGFGEVMRLKGRATIATAALLSRGRLHPRLGADPDPPRIAARCGRVVRSGGGFNPPRSQSVTRKNGASCATSSLKRTSHPICGD